MEVLNIHERVFETDPLQIGALIDSLASKGDRLWPNHVWPRMEFDRPLGVGADGGHGPIRYYVEEYTPGQSIKFRFTGPKGFDGFHGFEIISAPEQPVVLRHTLRMNTYGPAIVSWPLVYRPMHDALIEDSLSTAQVSLGLTPKIQAWSLRVKILRWVVSGGKARTQVTPNNSLQPTSPRERRIGDDNNGQINSMRHRQTYG
jgi:hypothetical protein